MIIVLEGGDLGILKAVMIIWTRFFSLFDFIVGSYFSSYIGNFVEIDRELMIVWIGFYEICSLLLFLLLLVNGIQVKDSFIE